jgi:hypothetical protein
MSDPQPGDPDAAARRGRARVRGFLNHLIGYFAVMIVLVPLNVATTPDYPWFLFPLVGWGAPLALHAAWAMGLLDRGRQG